MSATKTGPLHVYKFSPGLDSGYGDITIVKELADKVDDLKRWCDSDSSCLGFNTNGSMKNKLQLQEKNWYKWTSDPKKGFYLKQQPFTKIADDGLQAAFEAAGNSYVGQYCSSSNSPFDDEVCQKWQKAFPEEFKKSAVTYCQSNLDKEKCQQYCRFQSASGDGVCDSMMSSFCQKNSSHPVCTCITSKLNFSKDKDLNPKCFDKSCLFTGYIPSDMQNAYCPTAINCVVGRKLKDLGYDLSTLTINSSCNSGSGQGNNSSNNNSGAPPGNNTNDVAELLLEEKRKAVRAWFYIFLAFLVFVSVVFGIVLK